MRRSVWLAGAALAVAGALGGALAAGAQESLLPPTFDNPAPAPAPRPTPTPRAAAPAPPPRAVATATPAPAAVAPVAGASPAVPPVPGVAGDADLSALPPVVRQGRLPSIAEIEAMDADQFDELFGLKPKFDIPAGARRALREIGVIDSAEGGFPSQAVAGQPAELVRAILKGTNRPLVSRWGHILLRRALASRLDAPQGMDPVEFAALRAQVLNRLGEGAVARALVQDVDSANYDAALAGAAFDAYLQTGDLLGICPVAQLKGDLRTDDQWVMSRAICDAYSGSSQSADRDLGRILRTGKTPRVDVLLAQRFAGAAGERRRAVTIEWNGITELNPWRFALARALGVDLPTALRQGAPDSYDVAEVLIPASPLAARVAAADRAGARGVLSSEAMVDLYSLAFAEPGLDDALRERATTLREAYVAGDPAARLEALRTLWGDGGDYGAQVLTAYAAARLPVSDALADEAPRILASMLSAGLDRNALRWGALVPEGSAGWALLALAQPDGGGVGSGGVESFIGNDSSDGQRKSRFLVAGLAGLGRIGEGDANGAAGRLGFDLTRGNAWTRKIDKAAELGNPGLVALLAGLGMQGDGWDKMTPRHLFHIVRALNRVGLGAEARMIAVEAVARG